MPDAERPTPFPSLPTPTASTDRPGPAPSYDDLARRLVPLPDSSYRPTAAAARDAAVPRSPLVSVDGGAAPDDAGVRAALGALSQCDLADVTVALTAGTATLTGSVARRLDRDAITNALGRVSGVVEIIDQLRIRTD